MSFIKGWRTVLFGSAVAVVGVLQQADWGTLIPAQYQGLALAAVGGVAIFLRAITSTSIGAKS